MGIMARSGSLLLLFSICLCLRYSSGAQWKFGNDLPGSKLVAHNNGEITLLEHTKRIQFTVPECYKAVYVVATVENPISNPEVSYDELTHTVVINYKLFQSSWSKYDVAVKALPLMNCRDS